MFDKCWKHKFIETKENFGKVNIDSRNFDIIGKPF